FASWVIGHLGSMQTECRLELGLWSRQNWLTTGQAGSKETIKVGPRLEAAYGEDREFLPEPYCTEGTRRLRRLHVLCAPPSVASSILLGTNLAQTPQSLGVKLGNFGSVLRIFTAVRMPNDENACGLERRQGALIFPSFTLLDFKFTSARSQRPVCTEKQ